MTTLKVILFSICSLLVFSCTNKPSENIPITEFYAPKLDLYVFRGSYAFKAPNNQDVSEYLLDTFQNTSSLFHQFQIQNEMSFKYSEIRIFYVKIDSSTTPSTDWSSVLRDTTILTLTDDAGLIDKGTVNVDFDRVRIFLAYNISLSGSAAGFSTIGSLFGMEDQNVYKQYSIAVSSFNNSNKKISYTLSHEMGHYFGLKHPFDGGCDGTLVSGTTNRIMDYTSTPEIFVTCEQERYKELAQARFSKIAGSYSIQKNTLSMKNASSSVAAQQVKVYNGSWHEKIEVGSPNQKFIQSTSIETSD